MEFRTCGSFQVRSFASTGPSTETTKTMTSLESNNRVKVYKMIQVDGEDVWDDQGTGIVDFIDLEVGSRILRIFIFSRIIHLGFLWFPKKILHPLKKSFWDRKYLKRTFMWNNKVSSGASNVSHEQVP